MSILNVNKINPVGGGSTVTIAGIASVTNNISVGNSVTATDVIVTNVSAGSSVTANSFHGSGANLTGISAGTSLSGSTNNTVCTVTGANAIKGEANLTFNGGETGDAQLTVHAAEANANSDSELILETSNDFATSAIMFKDSTAEAGSVAYNHGDNYMKFSTFGTDGGTERMRISKEGYVTQPNTPSFHAVGMSGSSYDNGTMTGAGSGPSHNIGNHYDGSTGIFTAPVAGRYLCGCGVLVENGTGRLEGNISKNNSATVVNFNGTGTTYDGPNATAVVNLAANDTLRVKRQSGNAYDSNHGQHYFFAHLIG